MTHILVFCGRIGTMWFSPQMMDVPYWMLSQTLVKGFMINKIRLKGNMTKGYALEE
jgi:hypothetical protein